MRQLVRQDTIRRRLDLRGQVQGVGFRPFVYRLARELALVGHVANDSRGATIEVEGPAERVAAFEAELPRRLPPLARVAELQRHDLPVLGETAFRIIESRHDPQQRPAVTPDAAVCGDCLRELHDPADRRHRYPFINCTNCGPRYSIIRSVPYDRPATTMAVFRMCPPCEREYRDPTDRRFHAQPNACAACGPQLRLVRVERGDGQPRATDVAGEPLAAAARLLAEGRIVAVKGIGGYHLACRADREEAVRRLRERKLRDGKPLALMVPSEAAARAVCRLTAADLDALRSAAAPIVLAPRAEGHGLAPGIAPGCGTFGIMLPYAPVHHLLFAEGLGALVMTSANIAGQPLTYRDQDAFAELHDVADAFLLHDREIFRPIDDSVVFTFRDQTIPIRRARGYAPQPLRPALFGPGGPLEAVRQRRILAVGGELKATVCLLGDGGAIVSEHLGDLSNAPAYRHFVRAVERLEELLAFSPQVLAHDLHPQYLSTAYAAGRGLPRVAVQHHHAHIAGVMAEADEAGPVVGLACDGTGYGTDGAVWGGEVLFCERGEFERVGHLEYFPLVGGDAAAVETWRPAAALLRQAVGPRWPEALLALDAALTPTDAEVFERQAVGGLNSPPSSSLGRVFDAVSFLLGLCRRNRHEAEAAMALEAAAGARPAEPYAFGLVACSAGLRLSLVPAIAEILQECQAGAPRGVIAARFHETVAQLLVAAAAQACWQRGVETVALSGGCFANRRLLGRVVECLESRGLRVLYNRQVPAGDGGLSLGQAWVAAWRIADGRGPAGAAGEAGSGSRAGAGPGSGAA